MTININGADMATLTIFKMELQRNLDMNLQIDPIITKYMQGRISDIEGPTPKTERGLSDLTPMEILLILFLIGLGFCYLCAASDYFT